MRHGKLRHHNQSTLGELFGLLGRFVLALILLPFVPVLIQHVVKPRFLSDDRKILRPLDDFTGPPRPLDPRTPAKPDDSWVRPGEHLIEAFNAPEGSWPMVEGKDGRLYQLTPSGRRLLDSTEQSEVRHLLWRGDLKRRPYNPEVDGQRPGPAAEPPPPPSPPAVTFPTVKLPDGRLVQLGPDGEQRPVPPRP